MIGAVGGNQILVLEYLLDKGADPDIQDIDGNYDYVLCLVCQIVSQSM